MFPELATGAIFLSCAAIIAADDYRYRIVPDLVLVIVFATGAFYGFWTAGRSGEGWLETLPALAFRSAVPGLSALAAALFYRFFRGREGLGLGDVKLMAAAGIWLPVTGSFYALAAASIAALVFTVAIALWRGKRAALTDSLPFAVFLAPTFWLLWVLVETGVCPALD